MCPRARRNLASGYRARGHVPLLVKSTPQRWLGQVDETVCNTARSESGGWAQSIESDIRERLIWTHAKPLPYWTSTQPACSYDSNIEAVGKTRLIELVSGGSRFQELAYFSGAPWV